MTLQTDTGTVEFVEYHQPDLPDGDYTITVKQTIKAENQKVDKQNFSADFPTTPFQFSVLGPRFSLDPRLVESVFPPLGSQGDYSNVLPYILLNRNTLPWERMPVPNKEAEMLPWMALLLFEEKEISPPATGGLEENLKTVSTVKLGDLISPTTRTTKWPGISLESGQQENDPVLVIDVPWKVLKIILSMGSDLRFLAHVRQTQEATGKAGENELAVIIGNRLPRPGSISIVHLVSMEGRYKDDGSFNDQDAKEDDSIRFVTLKSWRFTCLDKKDGGNFVGLLKQLDHSSALRLLLPAPEDSDSSAKEIAEKYLAMGYAPLPHAMRQGNKTISWYRGPLIPGKNTAEAFPLPIRSADELVYYDETYGMFDVSYAAAWELGRLLALQSKNFSLGLYRWKRTHAQKLKDVDTQLTHLPFDGPSADSELPEAICSWFERLTLLEGVPFYYLVPDERMLPVESIRFFQIDPIWMECLVDGAFSIGRVLQSDQKRDGELKDEQFAKLLPGRVSGFLMRSDIVAGWPGLQVEGYDISMKGEQFSPEKQPLIEDLPLGLRDNLDSKKITDELKQKLGFSDQYTIENRQWLIESGEQKFLLIKRENNEIDVCSADSKNYLFSIDAGFQTSLNTGTVSTDLQQAFEENKRVISQGDLISVASWFITDDEYQKHYLITTEEEKLNVYLDHELPLLRMDRLSANILICLFEGIVQSIDFHLKPETLHFGVDKPDEGHTDFYKNLKDSSGKSSSLSLPTIPWKEKDNRVIDIDELAEKIKEQLNLNAADKFSSADFALQLIESDVKVRFLLTGHAV